MAGGSDDFTDALVLRDHPGPALAVLGWLALVNAVLFVFNLIPAFPLDGGRIARAIAWKVTGDRNRGTRFSARLGQGFAYFLMGLGVFLHRPRRRRRAGSGGSSSAGSSASRPPARSSPSRFSERLEGVTVADVMDTQPVWVPGDTTVLQAQDEFFLRYRWPWFPVVDPTSGRFLGLLHQSLVDGAVRTAGPALSVADVVDADGDEAFRVRDDTPIEQLLGSEGLRSLGRADGRRPRRAPARRGHARAGPPRADGRGPGPRRVGAARRPRRRAPLSTRRDRSRKLTRGEG